MFPIGAFFIGVGTAAAIAAVLALVMAIADATIANYGEVKISINDGSKELTVDGGRPLLSTLTAEGIFIPSACGGRGSCGLCKLAVKSGAGEYAPTELPWITEADRKANVRLSCQVKVKRDMQILVPEELFSIKEYETTVASIRDLTYDIKEVTLKLKDSQALDFKAGQLRAVRGAGLRADPRPGVPGLLHFLLPVAQGRGGAGDPPGAQRHLHHLRVPAPEGRGQREHQRPLRRIPPARQRPGHHLRGRRLGHGPDQVASSRTWWSGASGARPPTSSAPARCATCSWWRRCGSWRRSCPGFKFVPALSNPEPGDNWTGEKGLITEVLDRHFQRLDHHEAYLCGSPGMIDASIKVFKAKGLPEELIFFDKFA